jgi:hypothetical protein
MQEPHPSGTEERPSVAPGDRPADGDPAAPAVPAQPVEVAVKRTGGFAGMTKQWRAEPPADEASVWIDLIAQCPWDAPDSLAAEPARGESEDGRPPAGADRFTWWIHARCGEDEEREAELPDAALVGAWRELVEAVRAWSLSTNR